MKDDFAIIERRDYEDSIVFVVDTDKAVFKGYRWKSLGSWGKRKFENMMVMIEARDNTRHAKIIYV